MLAARPVQPRGRQAPCASRLAQQEAVIPTYAHAEQLFEGAPSSVWPIVLDDAALVAAFRGAGPIPALVEVVRDTEAFEVGMERTVHSADGSTARERMLVIEAPTRQVYELFGFSGVFRFLVRRGTSEWVLTEVQGGTLVTWDYTFELTTPLVWPIVRALMPFFERAQAGCLEVLASSDER